MADLAPLRRFILDHFRLPRRVKIADDQDLLSVISDPFGLVEIADFVEEEYGIRFDRSEVLEHQDEFRSLRGIESMIDRKRSGAT